MEWTEARDRTLATWQQILDGVGSEDSLKLVTRVNEVCELCDKAREEAGSDAERCDHCIVFGSARRCADARLAITETLLDGDFEQARQAISAVISRVICARPPEAAGAVAHGQHT